MDNEPVKEESAEKPDTPRIEDRKRLFQGKKNYALYGVIAVLVVLMGIGFFTGTFTGKAVSEGSVKLEFYVMSQCYYGTQVEDAIAPVLKKLGDSVDFSIDFIGNANRDGTFDSLKGQSEVDENIRQLCAMKLSPKKYMDFIVCQNKDIRNAAANAESCAKEAGIDADALKACFEGDEGKQLLTKSFAKANAARAQGSPTIKLNGADYNSGRATTDFLRALCQNLKGHPECSEMPECTADAECTSQPDKEGRCVSEKCEYNDPVQFEVVVVNDAKCATCDPAAALQTTRTFFKGANIRTVDISSDEGKKLVSDLGLKFVPSYLFSEEVTTTSTWNNPQMARLQNAFEKKGDWYKLLDEAVGASHWIDEKARNEQLKSMGITLGDNKPTLNLFVMSQCPYGVMAEQALWPVIELLGDKLDFQLDFIVSENAGGTFNSLHGQPETDENIRQLCARKLDDEKYLDYIACQNEDYKNVGTNWEKCAVRAGIDKTTLKTCSEGAEGKALLSASAKKAAMFGASGSPTIVIDGESYNGVRTPAAFQAAICSMFETAPAECGTVLASVAGTAALAAGGCGA
ncbi:MAG: hypothetical protein QME12_02200 [Nanoarchaeota archaeon]|nr:hypothetical protein [Nanoarchaeota archaeon]